MPSHRPSELALYHGVALGQFSAGYAEFNKPVVSPCRRRHGRLLPLDVIPFCHRWNRSSCQAFVCRLDYLFTGDARSARFRPTVMQEDYRKKNRRLLIVFIVFAVGFTVAIILWKLSIYQKL